METKGVVPIHKALIQPDFLLGFKSTLDRNLVLKINKYSSLAGAEVMKIMSNIHWKLSEKSKETSSFVLQVLLLILCIYEVDRIIY